ncbi:MAG: O-antigen ligase family protein [Coriobacteriia bacterium]|nr:O-antigen ligase family protein [Coriobacteriia bacterium]
MSDASHRHLTLSGLLAVVLAMPLLGATELNPLLALIGGALAATVAGTLLVLRRAGTNPRSPSWIPTALWLALALWLSLRSAFADNIAVSFLGTIAQHSGAAMWLIAGCLFAAAALLGSRRALQYCLGVASVAGALYALAGIVEALIAGQRTWGSAAGLFENSASLGSFLAVTLFASLAWFLAVRSTGLRVTAAASALVAATGILAADSRTGILAALVGVAVTALVSLSPSTKRTRLTLAVGMPLAAVLVTAALTAASAGAFGADAQGTISRIGTDRDAIWRSAVAQIAADPLIGTGPEQFSTWILWSFDGADLEFNATYDPHNAILGLALAGGIPAVLIALAAAISMWFAHLSTFHELGRPRVLVPVVAVPTVLATSAIFVWTTPAALFVVAMLAGCLLGLNRESSDRQTEWSDHLLFRASAAAFAVACILTAILGVVAIGPERTFSSGRTENPDTLQPLYQAWPDPAYASAALASSLARGESAEAGSMDPQRLEADAGWHVDLALRRVFVAAGELDGSDASWARFEASVQAGIAADPASGLWATLAAAQARRLDRESDAQRWIGEAKRHHLDAATALYLDGVATP